MRQVPPSIPKITDSKQNLVFGAFKNALWNGGARLVVILLNIVTVPVFIVKLGAVHYGIYILILSLLSVMQLFCMGTGEATIKFMAESEGRNKRDDTERYFRNGLFCLIIASFCGMITLIIFSEVLVGRILNVPPADQDVCRLSLLWFNISWLLRNLNVGLWSIPIAFQRYDILVALRDGQIVAERLLGLGIVIWGGGIVEVFQIHFVTLVVTILISIWAVKRLMPELVLFPALDLGIVKKMLRLGIWQSISSVGLNLRETVDRWIIGLILSPAIVGYYNAVMTVSTSIQGFIMSLGNVLFPTFSYLHGQERDETLSRMFISVSWLLNLLGAMLCIPSIILGHQFLKVWLGAEIPGWIYRLLVVVLIARIINNVGVLQSTFLVGTGKTEWNAFIGFSQLGLVVVMNWFLLSLFGELGLGWANFSIGLIAILVLVKMRNQFFRNVSATEYYINLSCSLLCSLLILSLFVGIFPQDCFAHVDSWSKLFVFGGVSALMVGITIVALSLLFPGRDMRYQMMAVVTNAVWSGVENLFSRVGRK